jgi:outer membrane protein TolC
MKVYLFIPLFIAVWINGLSGQSLADYQRMGLENNPQLRVAQSGRTVAQSALEEANKGRSLRVDFAPTYTLAAGGRVIAVPVGDLLNPVYGALNAMTGTENFPQIENAEELLNPNNFYDLRMRATYPIINQAIGVNQEIKQLELKIAGHEIERSRQQVVAEIAGAYYDYQRASRAVAIYQEAMNLVRESIRVNRGLLSSGAALPIDVRSAENDSLQLAKDLLNAELATTQAAALLNYLVNQPLDTPVPKETASGDLPLVPSGAEAKVRPELEQLTELGQLNGKLGDLAKARAGAQLNAFADFGLQDFNFNLSGQSPYVLAGLSFNVNLFDGGQTKAKQQLAQTRRQETQARRAAVEQQIALEIFTTRQDLEKRLNEYAALTREVSIRDQQYRDQLKRYRAGTINYIALQTARNELIQSQLQRNITRYQAWKVVADYKRALGMSVD